jgi:hypothetical protein
LNPFLVGTDGENDVRGCRMRRRVYRWYGVDGTG